jgi:uncharacterized protein Yka (UPF0111/DUF47 family)
VQALARLCVPSEQPVAADEFVRLRLIGKKTSEEISDAAYGIFVTALDREDIAGLAGALYKIPKIVDKFAARLELSPPSARRTDFSAQIGLLKRATEVVVEMVRSLRIESVREISTLNEQLQKLESEADQLMAEHYRELFSERREILEAIALKDLYEQLEKVIDRCRDAGNVIVQIALKNS